MLQLTSLQGNAFYVHVFKGADFLDRHGQKIDKQQLVHPNPDISPPDGRLIRWHYRQCLIKRFRCFSVSREDLELRAIFA